MKKSLLLIISALLFSGVATAQYFNTKGYYVPAEDFNFLFQPNEFTPFQTGDYGELSGQFTRHNLYYVALNPANTTRFSKNYLYVDYNRASENRYVVPYFLYSSLSSIYIPSPLNFYDREPQLSTAFFFKPFKNDRFVLGSTYQLMKINEQYMNLDYGFYPTAEFATSVFPGTMSYNNLLSGRNDMAHTGHFSSFYAGYQFSEALSVGAKISYNSYLGSGNQTLDQSDLYQGYSPQVIIAQDFDYNRQRRTDYSQWDASLGINFTLSTTTTAGFSMGFLTGDFSQYSDNYQYNNSLPDTDHYYNYNNTDKNLFDKNGNSWYATANLIYSPSNRTNIELSYRLNITNYDLSFADHSQNANNSKDSGILLSGDREVTALYVSNQKLWANANGNNSNWSNGFTITVDHQLLQHVSITSGVQVNFRSEDETYRQTFSNTYNTNRDFSFIESSAPDSSWQFRSSSFSRDKNDFERQTYSMYVPMIVNMQLFSSLNVQTGLIVSHFSDRINRSYQSLEYQYEYISSDESYSDSRGIQPASSNIESDTQSYVHLIGSVVYSPLERMSIRFVTTTNKMQSAFGPQNTGNYQFRLSLELTF
ncbi:MAG TPA: hypothetical protein DEQ34_10120 [Balneolaceae bacterium]|nr:hypothetical protein [Balneolaceae bacterium]|tara:strand:+ start:80784 stop:82559 length:1776 start_codon:yes stop_codon:yes gene_type:complete